MSDPDAAGSDRPDALLLDLGGVVVDLDFGRVYERWGAVAGLSADEVRSRFSMDEAYERHERAEIDAVAYFASVRERLDVDLTHEQLVEGWNDVFIDLFPGVVDLLHDLASVVPLYGLTNTNPTHAAHWSARFGAELDAFTAVFVSSEIGLRKPDAEVFEHVAASTGVPLDRIHFFDDSVPNVDGARAAGMPATLVTSYEQFAIDVRALVGI